MPTWFSVATNVARDDRIGRVLNRFGNAGLGALLRLWAHVAEQGARPGVGVNSDGTPFDEKNLAKATGVSRKYLRELLGIAAKSGHIDRVSWEAKGIVIFPALARRLKAHDAAKTSGQRMQDHRDRAFERVAEKCGNVCVHCGSPENLELERIIPKELGGTNEESNVQTACVSCARKRRADRERKGGQNVTQDVTGRDADAIRSDQISSTSGGTSTDLDQTTHTPIAGARVAGNDPGREPEPVPLGLIGTVPRKLAHGPAPFLTGSLPRDHLKCLAPCGAICYPMTLAEEHARALNIGDHDAAIDKVREFRDRVLAAIPKGQAIGDRPYDFWRAHWSNEHGSAAPARQTTTHGNPEAGRVQAQPGKYDRINRRDQGHDKKRSSR